MTSQDGVAGDGGRQDGDGFAVGRRLRGPTQLPLHDRHDGRLLRFDHVKAVRRAADPVLDARTLLKDSHSVRQRLLLDSQYLLPAVPLRHTARRTGAWRLAE